jgi:hypothetical protein
LCFFFFFSLSSSLGGSLLLLEGLSGGFTSKVGRGLPPASRGQDIALVSSTLKGLSSSFPTSASGTGFFKVCKNKAAFLLRSA